jgi:PadR family transcriptional regulator PadR
MRNSGKIRPSLPPVADPGWSPVVRSLRSAHKSINNVDLAGRAFVCERPAQYQTIRLPSPYFFIIIEQMRKRPDSLSDFELMVMLALMRLGDKAYGVPISREIEEQCRREVALGSVYAALERLQEKGLVVSELGEPTPERGGRAKRFFRVTPRGLRDVRATRQALIRLWKGLPQLEGGRP